MKFESPSIEEARRVVGGISLGGSTMEDHKRAYEIRQQVQIAKFGPATFLDYWGLKRKCLRCERIYILGELFWPTADHDYYGAHVGNIDPDRFKNECPHCKHPFIMDLDKWNSIKVLARMANGHKLIWEVLKEVE